MFKLKCHQICPLLIVFFLFCCPALCFSLDLNNSTNTLADRGSNEISLVEAVKLTIQNNPNIKIYEMQQEMARAGVRSAKSAFDRTINASFARSHDYIPMPEIQKNGYRNAGSDITKISQGSMVYSTNYQKRFRNGITITPGISVTSTEANTSGLTPSTSGKIQFVVTKPLGRGKSVLVNTASEKMAQIELDATELDKLQTISQSIYNTCSAYWNYVYSFRSLQILKDSQKRSEKLLEDMRTLVESQETPAADLDQIVADLNQRKADTSKAQNTLVQARSALLNAIGLPAGSIIGTPANDFPDEIIKLSSREVSLPAAVFIDQALLNRKDYKAAEKRIRSFDYLLPSIKDNLKPQKDLQFSIGYNGLKEKKGIDAVVSSISNNIPGASVSATMSYSFPVDNNSAKAEISKQEAFMSQSMTKTRDLARTISLNVQTDVDDIINVISRYHLLSESDKLYEKALQNEKEKRTMGMSTVMDIINIESRLTQAEMSRAGALYEYSNALSKLRYDMGILGALGTSECVIEMEDLITLPDLKGVDKK